MIYSYEAHNPIKRKRIPWLVCQHCGLVYLNNPFTAWAIRKGCNSADHPEFQGTRQKYTARSQP